MGHEGGIYRSIAAAITPADEKSRPPEGRAALKKTPFCFKATCFETTC